MPKPHERIIVPRETTLVTSLFPDSDLVTAVGSTIISSLAGLILDNPGAHPELTTFVNSPSGEQTEVAVFRITTHTDRLDHVAQDVMLISRKMVVLAKNRGLCFDRFVTHTGRLIDDDVRQHSAEAMIGQARHWAGMYSASKLAALYHGHYFQKTLTYIRQRLVDILQAEQGERPSRGEPPWRCPMCGCTLPRPLPSRICPHCQGAFPRDWWELFWHLDHIPDEPTLPEHPVWMELSQLKDRYAMENPKFSRFIGVILRARTESLPGETERQALARLTGWRPKTVLRYLSRLEEALRQGG